MIPILFHKMAIVCNLKFITVVQIGCNFLADGKSAEFSNILILQDRGVQVSQIRDVVIY